jgi:hypothetical protein
MQTALQRRCERLGGRRGACAGGEPLRGARGAQLRWPSSRPSLSKRAAAATDSAVDEAELSDEKKDIQKLLNRPYKYGFQTIIESDTFPKGLSEDVVRAISAKKKEPEWMLEFRLRAYKKWLTMEEPAWSDNRYPTIDYQDLSYYSEPKVKEKKLSLDEVDPELLRTFDKLGIPLNEQKRLANVAVDAVFDSVSIATTFREELSKAGVIFCSISEAVREYPDLVRKHLGSVVRSRLRPPPAGRPAGRCCVAAAPARRRARHLCPGSPGSRRLLLLAAAAATRCARPLLARPPRPHPPTRACPHRCRWLTTTLRRSTRLCSATAPLSTSPRACARPWSCPPTSASTPARRASSSARSSWRVRGARRAGSGAWGLGIMLLLLLQCSGHPGAELPPRGQRGRGAVCCGHGRHLAAA